MAERLMKKIINDKGLKDIKVISRGISANGENINANAKFALKQFKALSTNRKSVKLGKIDKNILYITMTDEQKKFINSKNVLSLKSLIGKDIIDPYGKDKNAYLLTANELLEGIKVLVEKLELWR